MFHEGDLQSGISKALAEQKLVACFVHSDNEESRVWEQQWLSTNIRPAPVVLWAEKAVILKLEYGSTEAGFLAAFCPITTSPTLVVIDKGKVLEKIESGVSQEDFTTRLNEALGLSEMYSRLAERQAQSASAAGAEPATSQPTQSATTDAREPEVSSSALPPTRSGTQQPATSSSSDSRPNTTTTTSSPDMSSLFPDRAQRHEVEATRRAAAEKAERTARAKARQKEEAAALARSKDKGKGRASEETETEKSKAAARRDWITQQKIRKDEAKKDRERILAQIEADKQERKARSQRPAAESVSESRLPTSIDAASRRRTGAGGMCSLQIRLFDGTSIKGRFEPSATLDKDVRSWIKSTATAENAADVPFTFKQIIAPKPSRSIEVSEEHQTLSDLGLTPNATLVLVPIAGYTEAYTGNAGRGYMSSALHYTYALANGASSVLGSALSYVPGLSGPAASASTDSLATNTDDEGGPSHMDGSVESIGSARVKMKTLADQRAEDEREKDKNPEFYNGNSSAFEGRKDD